MEHSSITKKDKIIGCLLGTAAGDSLGLPCEGLSKRRQKKIYREIKGHAFFFNKGMVSDDTEHTVMVAKALLETDGEVKSFIKNLSWKFRFWFMSLPAGIGMATLKSCLKLCLGWPGDKSGVFSAGNGPAMRSAIIGVIYGENREKMKELVRASTWITHRDPKAEYGALAVALAAYMSDKECSPDEYYIELEKLIGKEGEELLCLVKKAVDFVSTGKSTEDFAESIGLGRGISGYIYNTVPPVIYCWFKHKKNFRDSLIDMVRCGGDTDTTGAILGAITGAAGGKEVIPEEWINNIWDWPLSVTWIEELGKSLSENNKNNMAKSNFAGSFVRNIFFTIIVLLHGFRRLLPPY
jgi:ADP-ribosylglycohydrolase